MFFCKLWDFIQTYKLLVYSVYLFTDLPFLFVFPYQNEYRVAINTIKTITSIKLLGKIKKCTNTRFFIIQTSA